MVLASAGLRWSVGAFTHFSRKVEVILGLTYFFSTVKEGMDMICVNYLVLLKEVECSKYKAANNHPHDECIIFF